MMHQSLQAIARTGLALTAMCMFMTGPAAASDPAEPGKPPLEDIREFQLETQAERDEQPGWLARENFHLAKKAGFGYTHRFKVGERPLSIGVRGPVMRKHKALGLRFRIRF